MITDSESFEIVSKASRRFRSATLGILCFQERSLCVLRLRTFPNLTHVAGFGLLGEVWLSIYFGALFGELASVLREGFVCLLLDNSNVAGNITTIGAPREGRGK